MGRLTDVLAPGSRLVVTHASCTPDDAGLGEVDDQYEAGRITLALRSRDEIARVFGDFEVLEPGLVGPDRWRPELGELAQERLDPAVAFYAGVARRR